jgi:hypothetical protein
MTGAADCATSTISIDTRDVVLKRSLHQREARIGVNHPLGTIMLYVRDHRHELLYPSSHFY